VSDEFHLCAVCFLLISLCFDVRIEVKRQPQYMNVSATIWLWR